MLVLAISPLGPFHVQIGDFPHQTGVALAGQIGRILIPRDRIFEILLLLVERAEPARKIDTLRFRLMSRVTFRRFAARAIRRSEPSGSAARAKPRASLSLIKSR